MNQGRRNECYCGRILGLIFSAVALGTTAATYLNGHATERLAFAATISAVIFSVVTLVISFRRTHGCTRFDLFVYAAGFTLSAVGAIQFMIVTLFFVYRDSDYLTRVIATVFQLLTVLYFLIAMCSTGSTTLVVTRNV